MATMAPTVSACAAGLCVVKNSDILVRRRTLFPTAKVTRTSLPSRFAGYGSQIRGTEPRFRRDTFASPKSEIVDPAALEKHDRDDKQTEVMVDMPACSESASLQFTKRQVLATAASTLVLPVLASGGVDSANASELAKDSTGKAVSVSGLLASSAPTNRILVKGIDNAPTYVVVDKNAVSDYAIKGICSHQGCTPPWDPEKKLFVCPCHGSQYDSTGDLVQGPAPYPLRLLHVKVVGDNIQFSDWTETDFRTDERPWWLDETEEIFGGEYLGEKYWEA